LKPSLQNRRHIVSLIVAYLQSDNPIGLHEPCRILGDGFVGVKPIQAAIQSGSRIKFRHFGSEIVNDIGRYIGRI
jgi:hypothetical protein